MKSAAAQEQAAEFLKEPDAHQLLMLASESDHCLSAGFRHSGLAEHSVERQPSSGPTLPFSMAE